MTALLLAVWTAIKPHALLVFGGLGIAVGSFALGYHLAKPTTPVTVQVAHAQTQIRDTAQARADSVLTRQNDSLTHRLAQVVQSRVGIDAILADLTKRLSVTSTRADSLAVLAADTLPDSTDHPVATLPPPDTEIVHLTRFVAACDTLRISCQAFRDSANALRDADHALIAAQATELKAWLASQPSRFARVRWWAGLGTALIGGYIAGHQRWTLH